VEAPHGVSRGADRAQQQQRRVAVAAQQPSPAALNPAWVPIVTSGLSMERGRPTFGGVSFRPFWPPRAL